MSDEKDIVEVPVSNSARAQVPMVSNEEQLLSAEAPTDVAPLHTPQHHSSTTQTITIGTITCPLYPAPTFSPPTDVASPLHTNALHLHQHPNLIPLEQGESSTRSRANEPLYNAALEEPLIGYPYPTAQPTIWGPENLHPGILPWPPFPYPTPQPTIWAPLNPYSRTLPWPLEQEESSSTRSRANQPLYSSALEEPLIGYPYPTAQPTIWGPGPAWWSVTVWQRHTFWYQMYPEGPWYTDSRWYGYEAFYPVHTSAPW